MNKYNFLLSSFRVSSIKSLFQVYKKVKKNSNKKFIILDMIISSIKYKSTFHDYLNFEFYVLTNEQRKTYLTTGKNIEIIKNFNNLEYSHIFNNKEIFNNYFKKYLNREYLKPNSTKKEFYNFINEKDKIVIKPTNNNLKIVETKNIDYNDIKNNLLEEVITQNKKLAELYDESISSISVITFNDGKNITILQSVLKIGSNGLYAFLDNKGTVATPAIDQENNIFGIHPISKKQILGFKVPMYNEVLELALKLSNEIPQVQYIEWNIAITNDIPTLISGSFNPKIFQLKPRFDKKKTGLIPLYEKIMNIKL